MSFDTLYTVEIYKSDNRRKTGDRQVYKKDHVTDNITALIDTLKQTYPASKKFRIEFCPTFVTRTNLITGEEFQERYDTPYCCSPRSETYWSM